MSGHRNISSIFELSTVEHANKGMFDWQTRMGVHLAFHRDPVNIFLHIVMPPFNALGLFLCLYPFVVSDATLFGEPISLAMIAFFVSIVLFLMVDVLGAVLTALPMALLYPLCAPIYEWVGESALWMIVIGSVVFLIALWVQVGIGHSVCEKGIGDENENIAELFETKNPIYFTLLPIYTTMDLLFICGYRKNTARYVMGITHELRPKVEMRKQEQPDSKGI